MSTTNPAIPLADSSSGFATWATPDEVTTITGVSVTQDQVQRAQFIIDMTSGRTVEMYHVEDANLHHRDLYFLKLAVAYQTAWMIAQPDMFTRMDMSDVAQERGLTTTFKAHSMKLAPLAKSALGRLSWKGTRSQRIGFRWGRSLDYYSNPERPIVDEPGEMWSGLGVINDASAITHDEDDG